MKIFTFFLFLGITTTAINAQTSYGVRAALNASNLDFDPDATFSNDHRNGVAVGFFIEYDVSESISIMPELQYSEEGGNSNSLKADYLNLPVQFRFNIIENIAIGVGPQASLKLWSKEDGFNTFTFSGIAGLEYTISNTFFVDARYGYGLSNVFDKDLGADATNSTFQFGVGIKID